MTKKLNPTDYGLKPYATKVVTNDNGVVNFYLHDNWIAFVKPNGFWWITTQGWNTQTTKDRLNAVLNFAKTGLRLFQKDKQWYITDGTKTVKYLRVFTADDARYHFGNVTQKIQTLSN